MAEPGSVGLARPPCPGHPGVQAAALTRSWSQLPGPLQLPRALGLCLRTSVPDSLPGSPRASDPGACGEGRLGACLPYLPSPQSASAEGPLAGNLDGAADRQWRRWERQQCPFLGLAN